MINYKSKILLHLSLALTLISSAAMAEISVVVNPANANALSADEIKRIFLGKKSKFPDGSRAVPVGQDDKSAVVTEFNEKVLDRSSNQLKAYWSKLIFTGKGAPPKKAGSNAEVLKMVASEPDKIGFVDSASVDGSVKVVLKL